MSNETLTWILLAWSAAVNTVLLVLEIINRKNRPRL